MKTINSGFRILTVVVAAVVMAFAMTSCSGSGRQQTSPDGPIPDSVYTALDTGTLYALIGQPGSANVWELDLRGHRSKQLTHNRSAYGISWLSASAAGLALADAQNGVDDVSLYRNGRSADLAGHGGAPAISPTGSVAYIEVPDVINQTSPQPWRIGVMSANGGPSHVLYQQSDPDLGALAFGPGSQLAVISAPGPRTTAPATPEIVVVDPSGSVRSKLDPQIGDIGFIAWNDKAEGIAVGSLTRHEELIDPVSGKRTALPDHWTPQCWSPTGTSLIVTQGDHIGTWRMTSPTQVEDIGALPTKQPLTGCGWLSAPAANT